FTYGRIEGDSAHVFVDPERDLDRGQRSLLAIGALAEAARHADRHARLGVLEVDAVRIDELLRELNLTAEPDRLNGMLRMIAAGVLLDRPRDAEVHRAVTHARDLDADHAGREECAEHVPSRTRAGEAREADARCAEALRD